MTCPWQKSAEEKRNTKVTAKHTVKSFLMSLTSYDVVFVARFPVRRCRISHEEEIPHCLNEGLLGMQKSPESLDSLFNRWGITLLPFNDLHDHAAKVFWTEDYFPSQ